MPGALPRRGAGRAESQVRGLRFPACNRLDTAKGGLPSCQTPRPPLKIPAMWALCKEFFLFLMQEKKWWLWPLVILLLILGALILFSSSSVLAPLMYPFM